MKEIRGWTGRRQPRKGGIERKEGEELGKRRWEEMERMEGMEG